MSILKFKIEVHLQIDSLDYPLPADGRMSLQLKDDIQEAIESSIPAENIIIKVTKTAGKTEDEEVRDYD